MPLPAFVDWNECAAGSHICVSKVNGGRCTNTNGSYECSCRSGYIGNGVRPGLTLQDNSTGAGCGKCAVDCFFFFFFFCIGTRIAVRE